MRNVPIRQRAPQVAVLLLTAIPFLCGAVLIISKHKHRHDTQSVRVDFVIMDSGAVHPPGEGQSPAF